MFQKSRFQILVVDDSITNVVLLNAVLTEEGYKVQTAFSVPDALKLISSEKPDLVLLDLNIPYVSGIEMVKNMKSNNEMKNIPVIIVTGYGDQEKKKQLYSFGVIDYIEKPIDIDKLIDKVNTLFKPVQTC